MAITTKNSSSMNEAEIIAELKGLRRSPAAIALVYGFIKGTEVATAKMTEPGVGDGHPGIQTRLPDASDLARSLAPKDTPEEPAYPNHSDTDIWVSGFNEGFISGRQYVPTEEETQEELWDELTRSFNQIENDTYVAAEKEAQRIRNEFHLTRK